jgi:hypothetical protein
MLLDVFNVEGREGVEGVGMREVESLRFDESIDEP